ncbi:MAG: DUF4340 domain-containing protein [Akkermansiaceae bacterium]|nr:DUF4340 domain-containing protein [Akkermansiaceae bacterium]
MRSLSVTFLFALFAIASVAVAVLQWKEGNFDRIFGVPPLEVGETLYNDFKPADVARIEIRSGRLEGVFEKENEVWQALTPWDDRMDPNAAAAIIRFTLGMRVEDHSPAERIDLSAAGLGRKATRLRLIDAKGELLAHYHLGKVASWKARIEGMEQPVSTVFVQPQDELGDEHIYLCTGDITPLFQEDLKLLRDHNPFHFNPHNIQTINIVSPQGEITLSRENPKQLWRITKPLKLLTDKEAIKALVNGLVQLRATRVRDRSEVTLPTNSTDLKTTSITLTRFGGLGSSTLRIYPQASLEETTQMATVSDRPNTVFELPAKPSPGLVSLADLPLDVNSLRDKTLLRPDLEILRGISIEPSTGPAILLEVGDGKDPVASVNGKSFPANQENLERLLLAVATSRVNGFVSDAATDFSPWGLDRPILKLRFIFINNQAIELRFGIDSRGDYYVNRTGTPIVMKVDASLIRAIAVQPHEWKHSRLWSLNRVDLTGLVIERPDTEPLVLTYNFMDVSPWKARRGNQDLTPKLVGAHATFMLDQLEGLRVARWLSASDAAALSALGNPSLMITAFENIVDEDDEVIDTRTRTVAFAPAPDFIGYHYGMRLGGSNPFLIKSNVYRKLAAKLLEQ